MKRPGFTRRPSTPAPSTPAPSTSAPPQAYDTTPLWASSFPDAATADRRATAVLQAHGDRVRTVFSTSRPGITRRLAPLRHDLDEPVGIVVDREGRQGETRTAVVLLHDIGGGAHVFSCHPAPTLPPLPEMPALAVLFGAYLHPDWLDEHPGAHPLAPVGLFALTEPGLVPAAMAELEQLSATRDEQQRGGAVVTLGSAFVPRPPGQLDRFLAEARAFLATAPPA